MKSGSAKKRWDGAIVCANDFELRNPLDFIRGRTEKIGVPFTRPEPEDSFLDDVEDPGLMYVGGHVIGADFGGFTWTEAGGFVELPITAGSGGCYVAGVSSDGAVVIGGTWFDDGECVTVWGYGDTPLTFFDDLVAIPYSEAESVSADGSVIVGEYEDAANATYVFKIVLDSAESPTITTLGGTNGNAQVSGDGTKVVGNFLTHLVIGTAMGAPFVWNAAGATTTLPYLPTYTGAFTQGISYDGSIICGSMDAVTGGTIAVYWNNGTPHEIPLAGRVPTAFELDVAAVVSSDGTVIAGYSNYYAPGEYVPFVWISGAVSLLEMPADSNIKFGEFKNITADNTIILGRCRNVSGNYYFPCQWVWNGSTYVYESLEAQFPPDGANQEVVGVRK